MADGGYTPRQIDKFTLADVEPLFEEWGRLPTLRAMIAAAYGIKVKKADPPTPAVTDISVIQGMFPGGKFL